MITMTIGSKSVRNKNGQHEVTLADFADLPEASRDFIVQYGIRQYLQDATAGAESADEAKSAIAARVEKLTTGDLTRRNAVSGDKPDTVEGRALKNARVVIRAAMKAGNIDADKEAVAVAAKALVEGDPSFMAEAKKQIDAENAAKANASGSDVLAGIMAGLLAKDEDESEEDEEPADDE